MSDFGDNLRAFCVLSGMTRVGIAKACGFSQPTISRWINGTSEPHPNNVKVLCKGTGASKERLEHAEDGYASELVERLVLANWDYAFANVKNSADTADDLAYFRTLYDEVWDEVIPRADAHVALVNITDLDASSLPEHLAHAEIPSHVLAAHPGSFAVTLADNSMGARMPAGTVVVVDPALSANMRTALVRVRDVGTIVRRMSASIEYTHLAADVTPEQRDTYGVDDSLYLATADIDVLGRVVWQQGEVA